MHVVTFFTLFLAWLLPSAMGAGEGTRPALAEEITLLNELLHRTADDLKRWAYVEHRVIRDGGGRVKSEQLVRYDPSRKHAEQWEPVSIDGREPTERERAKFRRRGEEGDPMQPGSRRRSQPTLGESIDVEGASVAGETATHWVFELPLRQAGRERFPPEKFRVLVRVIKEGRLLENISVRLRESFRTKFVVKVKAGEASLDFSQVDAAHPPTLVAITGEAAWSVLFFGSGGGLDLRRTELRHVRPYDERFEVKIGTLRAIDF